MRRPLATAARAAFLLLAFAPVAQAHIVAGENGFFSGLAHPVLGYDHLLAMVCVGVLSAQMGGRAPWFVPGAFVFMMAVGGVMGLERVPIPSVETGIAVSVMALGAAIAAARHMPTFLAMVFVGVFAIFHGHAHGAEMPLIANPALYAIGFLLSTAGLHLTGVGIGLAAERVRLGPVLLRAAGVVISVVGVSLYCNG